MLTDPAALRRTVSNDLISIFVLEESIIILRASHSPMTLQTGPVLSTPHFILLHVGHFTGLVQRQRAGNDRKNCGPCFPREESNQGREIARSHSQAERVSLKNTAGIFTARLGVYLTSSAKISSGV